MFPPSRPKTLLPLADRRRLLFSSSLVWIVTSLLWSCGVVDGAVVQEKTPPTCPTGWLGVTSECFFISDHLTSWPAARAYCVQHKSDLSAISSETEETLLHSLINASSVPNGRYWIGFTDLPLPGVFDWVDGSLITYTNWRDEMSHWNASNAKGNCVVINSRLNMKWEIVNCSDEHGFVCRMRNTTVADRTRQKATQPSGCGPEMVSFRDSCYWTISGEDWLRSKEWCASEDGHLVTIDDSNENIFVYNLVRFEHKRHWLGMRTSPETGKLSRVDGAAMKYSNWNDKTLMLTADSCAVMGQFGKWTLEPCDFKYAGAVCEKARVRREQGSVVATAVTLRPSQWKCPVGWAEVDEECFLVEKEHMFSWDHARNQCLSLGGDLAAFRSQHEERNVYKNLLWPDHDKTSSSSSQQPDFGSTWIGLKIVTSTTEGIRWSDGDLLTYFNWGAVRYEAPVYCVLLRPSADTWIGRPCAQLAGFVCSRPAQRPAAAASPGHPQVVVVMESRTEKATPDVGFPPPPPPPNPPIPPPPPPSFPQSPGAAAVAVTSVACPPEWEPFGDKCFGFAALTANWTQALQFCRSLGPVHDLASIHSKEEQNFLVNMLAKHHLQEAWIGLNDRVTERHFGWSDGTFLDYSHWTSEELEVKQNQQNKMLAANCVAMTVLPSFEKWAIKSCSVMTGVVCQQIVVTARISMASADVAAFPPPPVQPPSDSRLPKLNPVDWESGVPHQVAGGGDIAQQNPPGYEDASDDGQVLLLHSHPNVGNDGRVHAGVALPPWEVASDDKGAYFRDTADVPSGTIAGIILGCLLGSATITAALLYAYHRHVTAGRPVVSKEKLSFDNALYNPSSDQIHLNSNGYTVSLA